MKTNPLAMLKMTTIGLGLFLHGRMPLKAPGIKAKKELKAILDKARALGGAK